MTLFEHIVGFDDIKEALRKSINENTGQHWLLVGPPGSARSMMLLDIEDKVEGAMFVSGTRLNKEGLLNVLRMYRPRFLLIDELDKCGPATLNPLLNLCANKRITSTTKGDPFDMECDTVVIGTANYLDYLGDYFLDRFYVIHFPEYTREEFINVCKKVLPRKVGVGIRVAKHIAVKVSNHLGSMSIRQAIRIGSSCKTKDDVDWLVNLLKKYGGAE